MTARLVRYLPPALSAPPSLFDEFETGELHGLARETARGACVRLDLLAVVAHRPGQGAFRRWLAEAKRTYGVIVVWEVWNLRLAGFLWRHGFTPVREYIDGEIADGWRWEELNA